MFFLFCLPPHATTKLDGSNDCSSALGQCLVLYTSRYLVFLIVVRAVCGAWCVSYGFLVSLFSFLSDFVSVLPLIFFCESALS